MRKALALLFVIALLALAPAQALAADLTAYSTDALNASGADESLVPPLEAAWVIKANNGVIGTPLVAGNTVYYTDGYSDETTSRGELVALDLATGKLKWLCNAGGSVENTPALVNDSLVFGAYDGYMYRVSTADGSLIWRAPLGDGMYSSPLVYEGKVYTGTDGSNFYALDLATGNVAWKLADNTTQGSPAGDRGMVFIGMYDGDVYALDASTGNVVWSYNTSSPIHASPAIFDGKVFIATRGGDLYAFDESSGAVLWHADLGYKADATPAVDPESGLIFVGTYGGYVKAFDASRGTMNWTSGFYGPMYSTIAVSGNTVYGVTQDGWMFALNKTDGSGNWGTDTGGVTFASPVVAEGRLVIGTLAGQVAAFKTSGAPADAYVVPSLSGEQVTSESGASVQTPFPGAMAAIGALLLAFVLGRRR